VTQKVRAVRIPVESSLAGLAKEIVLIDTPGFDDTTRSDLEVLRMIAEWLNQTYA
jgi:predicted GTPase